MGAKQQRTFRPGIIHTICTILCLIVLLSTGQTAAGQENITPVSTVEGVPEKETDVAILFVGDTSFGENYPGSPEVLQAKGYDYPLFKVAPLLAGADLVIANLETPVTDLKVSPLQESKANLHWMDIQMAPETLRKHHIRVFSLANNHSFDFGAAGLQQTIDVMSRNGMQVFGAGMNEEDASRPYEKSFPLGGHNFTAVVIGAFESLSGYDANIRYQAIGQEAGVRPLASQQVASQIRIIRKDNPGAFIILFPHWGRNYRWKADRQTWLARYLIDAGADLVIGHGAHAFQEIENYKGRWILYGIGNFVFLAPGRYAKLRWHPVSLAAQLMVTRQQDGLTKHLRLYPLLTDNLLTGYQTRPLNADEFEYFRQLLLAKSSLGEQQVEAISPGRDAFGPFLQLRLD